jgi:hypothetical protein
VAGVKFDTEQLFRYLVHHFGLSEKAKHTSVEFAITVRGEPLDDHCGCVTIWFNIVYKDAIDPIRGNNIFYELDNMQSCTWCFPITMLIAKYDKDTYYKYLRDIFKFCDRLRTEGLDEWNPFEIADQQDMNSFQLCLTRGGAAKGKHYFCHLCQIHSDDISLCNENTGSCAYALTAENGHTCHHIRLVNADCISEAIRELSGLQVIAEVQRMTHELQSVKVARGKTKWAILYEKCKLHLLLQGSATCVNNCGFTVADDAESTVIAAEAAKATVYQQKLQQTMTTLGLWKDTCNLDQPDQILLIKKVYIVFVECSIARIF